MKCTKLAKLILFCSTALLVVIGVLVAGCGYHAQDQQRGREKRTTGLASSSGELQSASLDSQSKNTDEERRDTNLVESFTIARDGDPILLPVSLDGKECLFMLDTGATFHTFDFSLRQYLGSPVRTGTGITGSTDIAIQAFSPPTARIGRLELDRDELVTCADLTVLRYATGKEIHGILGMPFFKRRIVQIDWDSGTLYVLKANTPPDAEWGQAFQVTFDKLGGPILEASLADDRPTRFLIDLGVDATGTLADTVFSQLIDRNVLNITGDRIVATAGGNDRRFTGRLDDLRVGQFTHRNLIFSQGTSNKLGIGYLSRYCVTFDLPNSSVYLKKAGGYSRTDHEDMSGLRLMRVEGETIVHSVDEGSPAYMTGIRSRDRIVQIAGKPASEYELANVRRLLRSGDGKEIDLTSKRGPYETTSTIRLKEKRPNVTDLR